MVEPTTCSARNRPDRWLHVNIKDMEQNINTKDDLEARSLFMCALFLQRMCSMFCFKVADYRRDSMRVYEMSN